MGRHHPRFRARFRGGAVRHGACTRANLISGWPDPLRGARATIEVAAASLGLGCVLGLGLYAGQKIIAVSYRSLEVYLAVAVVYLVLTGTTAWLLRRVEQRLSLSRRQAAARSRST